MMLNSATYTSYFISGGVGVVGASCSQPCVSSMLRGNPGSYFFCLNDNFVRVHFHILNVDACSLASTSAVMPY